MKEHYVQFGKNIRTVHSELKRKDGESKVIPADLNRCLADKSDDNYFIILDNLILLIGYIKKCFLALEKVVSAEGHVAIHISREKTKSLFPLQIIKTTNNEYLLIFSFKTKITDWVGRGLAKKVKEAIVLKINGKERKWVKAVDAVVKGDEIPKAITEIKLANSLDSNNFQKMIEGSLYTGKESVLKKSLISEFAEGGTIEDIIERNNLDFVNIFIIFYGSTIALQELHAAGIMHNDLHEGNIFLNIEEEKRALYLPIIADFGSSVPHANILSSEFRLAATDDIKRFSGTMLKFLKSSSIKNKLQHEKIQKLVKMTERINWGILKYTIDVFVEKLNDLKDEMKTDRVKDITIIEYYLTSYYSKKGVQPSSVKTKAKDYRLLSYRDQKQKTNFPENVSKDLSLLRLDR